MRRILVDTSLYSRAMQGLPEAAQVLRKADSLLICPVVVGELISGFKGGAHQARNRQCLAEFLDGPRVTSVPITSETAEFYADILNALKGAGTPIPSNDIWIAACAMEHGAHLATCDKHYLVVKGLLTIYP